MTTPNRSSYEQYQCKASPWDGVRRCQACVSPAFEHAWQVHPDRDAVSCDRCGRTYLGGPTVEVKP